MKIYQQRVIEEAEQLEDKLNKLNDFLSKEYLRRTTRELSFLIEQSEHMTAYLGVLRKRIKMFHDMNESI